jgi:hydroxymethylbilane synthase
VFESVRGNIPTRLKKLLAQDVDGLIVAKAALDRLLSAREEEFHEVQVVVRDTLKKTRFMILPLTLNPTAAAQGALAVEIAKHRDDLREVLAEVNCPETFACVEKERKLLSSYGGGCHQKIGVTVLHRSFGELTFLRGLTDQGEVLNKVTLRDPSNKLEQFRAESDSAVFPRLGEEASFFDREPLPRPGWAWAEEAEVIWVARDSAWPEGFHPRENTVVWSAGLRTWQKLAARGIWVNGSAEGLGEREPMLLDELLNALLNPVLKAPHGTKKTGSRPVVVKLTHDMAAHSLVHKNRDVSGMQVCATYRLVPRQTSIDLTGRTHFYWMSGTTFDRALELFPEIHGAIHCSGPGSTHEHLRSRLGSEGRIQIYLNIEDFRRSVVPEDPSERATIPDA